MCLWPLDFELHCTLSNFHPPCSRIQRHPKNVQARQSVRIVSRRMRVKAGCAIGRHRIRRHFCGEIDSSEVDEFHGPRVSIEFVHTHKFVQHMQSIATNAFYSWNVCFCVANITTATRRERSTCQNGRDNVFGTVFGTIRSDVTACAPKRFIRRFMLRLLSDGFSERERTHEIHADAHTSDVAACGCLLFCSMCVPMTHRTVFLRIRAFIVANVDYHCSPHEAFCVCIYYRFRIASVYSYQSLCILCHRVCSINRARSSTRCYSINHCWSNSPWLGRCWFHHRNGWNACGDDANLGAWSFLVFRQSQIVLFAQKEQILGYDHSASFWRHGLWRNRNGRSGKAEVSIRINGWRQLAELVFRCQPTNCWWWSSCARQFQMSCGQKKVEFYL